MDPRVRDRQTPSFSQLLLNVIDMKRMLAEVGKEERSCLEITERIKADMKGDEDALRLQEERSKSVENMTQSSTSTKSQANHRSHWAYSPKVSELCLEQYRYHQNELVTIRRKKHRLESLLTQALKAIDDHPSSTSKDSSIGHREIERVVLESNKRVQGQFAEISGTLATLQQQVDSVRITEERSSVSEANLKNMFDSINLRLERLEQEIPRINQEYHNKHQESMIDITRTQSRLPELDQRLLKLAEEVDMLKEHTKSSKQTINVNDVLEGSAENFISNSDAKSSTGPSTSNVPEIYEQPEDGRCTSTSMEDTLIENASGTALLHNIEQLLGQNMTDPLMGRLLQLMKQMCIQMNQLRTDISSQGQAPQQPTDVVGTEHTGRALESKEAGHRDEGKSLPECLNLIFQTMSRHHDLLKDLNTVRNENKRKLGELEGQDAVPYKLNSRRESRGHSKTQQSVPAATGPSHIDVKTQCGKQKRSESKVHSTKPDAKKRKPDVSSTPTLKRVSIDLCSPVLKTRKRTRENMEEEA